MFVFEYNNPDLRTVLHELAIQLNTKVENKKLVYPEWFANGYTRWVQVNEFVQAYISDFKLNDDYYLIRQPHIQPTYFLRIHEATVKERKIVGPSGNIIKTPSTSNNVICLYSNYQHISVMMPKGSEVKGASICFKPEWLANYLKLSSTEELFDQYTSLCQMGLHYDVLSFEYREIIRVMIGTIGEPLEETIIVNRIKLLIETFFDNISKFILDDSTTKPIRDYELGKLTEVEKILSNSNLKEPPSIKELSKMVGMSASSLKIKFKQVYQSSIYQYFQRNRMHQAMRMLLSGRYSVKQTGMELGFNNMSNFSKAFKKEFGILPGKIIRTEK
jgi:AraC-like DNA-binding protein